jgi:hypothetical protein
MSGMIDFECSLRMCSRRFFNHEKQYEQRVLLRNYIA